MACSAALAAVMPSRSETVRRVPRATACGRYPTSPRARTTPEPGRNSPAMSLSRVDLPEPFSPIRPVRPGPNEVVRPESTEAPSGQLKLRSEQTSAAVMRRGLPARRNDSGTCGDTTPRGLWLRCSTQRSRATSAVSLTSQPQRPLPPPTAETFAMLTRTLWSRQRHSRRRAWAPRDRDRDFMIVNSFGHYLPRTVHDHEIGL